MIQSQRTMQEYRSTLPPAEVLAAAKRFFANRSSIYAAFLDMEGPSYVSFRGQGTEELVISAIEHEGATLVTGSTYLFDMQVARFFTTLPPWRNPDQLLPPPPASIAEADVARVTA